MTWREWERVSSASLDRRRSKQHLHTTWLTQHREIYHKKNVDLEDVIIYDISNLHWIDTLIISELFIKQNFQHSRSPRTTP